MSVGVFCRSMLGAGGLVAVAAICLQSALERLDARFQDGVS